MPANSALQSASALALPQPVIGTPWWQARRPAHGHTQETSGSSVAFWALVAFTAILLLSPQAWFPVLKVLRIAFLAAGLAIAAHVVERTARRRPITQVSPEIGIALTLVCWSILTLPLSVWPGGSVRILTDYYLKAFAFFWLLGTVVTTTGRLRIMMWTLTLCAIPLAATGIFNYVAGEFVSTGVRGFQRIAGYAGSLTANPNDLALMLNLIIPLSGALVVGARGLKRVFAGATMLLCAVAVVLTFSRAGFLTLGATALLFVAMLVKQRRLAMATGLLLLAFCAWPLLPNGYISRISTITDIAEDATGSAQGRWRDTKVAAELVIKNPIVGAGIGQDVLVMNDERGIDTWRRVHNAYLQYGVDLGLPGLLLFAWLHLTCYRTARAVEKRAAAVPAVRELTPLAAGVKISLLTFGIAAMFHPIAYQFYFFSIAGLAVALRNTYKAAIANNAVGRALSGPPGEPDRVRPTSDDVFIRSTVGRNVRLASVRSGGRA
jgi:O-antigen ligase